MNIALKAEWGGRLPGNAPCIPADEAPMMDLERAKDVLVYPSSTRLDLLNAAHAFAFSPDPSHRILGREVCAVLLDRGDGEIVTDIGRDFRRRIDLAEEMFHDPVSQRRAEMADEDDRRAGLLTASIAMAAAVASVIVLSYAFCLWILG